MSSTGTGAWVYPWDLRDIPGLAALVREAGLDTICLAGSYHSLLAAVPGNRARPVFDLAVQRRVLPPRPGAVAGPDPPAARFAARCRTGRRVRGRSRFADRAGNLTHGVARLPARLTRSCATVPTLPSRRPQVTDCSVHRACWHRRCANTLCASSLTLGVARTPSSSRRCTGPAAARAAREGGGLAPRLTRLVLSLCFCTRCRRRADRYGVESGAVAGRLVERWSAAWEGMGPGRTRPGHGPGRVPRRAGRGGHRTHRRGRRVGRRPDRSHQFRRPGAARRRRGGRSGNRRGRSAAGIRVAGRRARDSRRAPGRTTPCRGCHCSRTTPRISTMPPTALPPRPTRGAVSVRFYHLGLAGERRRGWLPALVEAWRARAASAEEVVR